MSADLTHLWINIFPFAILCCRRAKTNLTCGERKTNNAPPSWKPNWCHWWYAAWWHIPDVWGTCPVDACDDTYFFRNWVKKSQWNEAGEGRWSDGAHACSSYFKTFHTRSKVTWKEISNGQLLQDNAVHHLGSKIYLIFIVEQFVRKWFLYFSHPSYSYFPRLK